MSNTNNLLETSQVEEGGSKQEEQQQIQKTSSKNASYIALLMINYLSLFIGSVSSSILSKFYFIHKGSSRWVSTFIQCVGFPLLLFPIFLPYYLFKCTSRKPFSGFPPKIIFWSIIIGFVLGLDNFLISWGTSYLPVSTFSLVLSSELAFTLIFSIILVKQKVTFTNLNCVVLLTLSSVLLGFGSGQEKPDSLSHGKFFIGFVCTLGAGLLFSLYFPILEILYKNVSCYSMVMEMQFIMEMAATVFATVGMAVGGGFSGMEEERVWLFDLGPTAYVLTVGFNVVMWQMFFVGTAGMVFLTTSLTGGVCMAALMAMNVIGGVLLFKDEFGAIKIVSTLLCGWGFGSYVYGLYTNNKIKQAKNMRGK